MQILNIFHFLEVVQWQLKDQLPDGCHADWSEELLSAATNVASERIFSSLDHLLNIMPSATTCAVEGITMWSQNHTADWLVGLDDRRKAAVLKRARQSVREQRTQMRQCILLSYIMMTMIITL